VKVPRPIRKGVEPLDEQAICLQAQRGDAQAFESLVLRHEEIAFRVAYLIVRDEAEAQDVAQEAFVRAYRSLGRFDTRQPFRPWLLRIVTNVALNSRRSAGRRAAAGERYERQAGQGAAPSPEAAVQQSEETRRVWEAVGQLDAKDQTLVYLRYFLGVSEQEAAAAIGRPAGTVKSRLHRALRRLRDVIERGYPDLVPERVLEARGASHERTNV
jgi:RNA polymerase sigma-70 factor (ECF subfamily)